jgi:hypothetical protein
MKLPPLSPEGADRLLEQLVRVRGMDPDDAMDWLETHYDRQDDNDSTGRRTR